MEIKGELLTHDEDMQRFNTTKDQIGYQFSNRYTVYKPNEIARVIPRVTLDKDPRKDSKISLWEIEIQGEFKVNKDLGVSAKQIRFVKEYPNWNRKREWKYREEIENRRRKIYNREFTVRLNGWLGYTDPTEFANGKMPIGANQYRLSLSKVPTTMPYEDILFTEDMWQSNLILDVLQNPGWNF